MMFHPLFLPPCHLACLAQDLLEKLFDWVSDGAMPSKKSQRPKKRDVVFICGGTG